MERRMGARGRQKGRRRAGGLISIHSFHGGLKIVLLCPAASAIGASSGPGAGCSATAINLRGECERPARLSLRCEKTLHGGNKMETNSRKSGGGGSSQRSFSHIVKKSLWRQLSAGDFA